MCGIWSSTDTQLRRATELEVTDLKTTQSTSQSKWQLHQWHIFFTIFKRQMSQQFYCVGVEEQAKTHGEKAEALHF